MCKIQDPICSKCLVTSIILVHGAGTVSLSAALLPDCRRHAGIPPRARPLFFPENAGRCEKGRQGLQMEFYVQ